MPEITISIPGKPMAKKRPRFARRGKYVQTYNEQETDEGKWVSVFMEAFKIKHPVRANNPFPVIKKGVPVSLTCKFIMPLLSDMPKYLIREIEAGKIILHVRKPDNDNCLKFVKDCLNKLIWADDAQVARCFHEKFYGVEPRTEITIRWDSEILTAFNDTLTSR